MKLRTVLFLLALLILASPIYAQGGAQAPAGGSGMMTPLLAIGMAIASGLCGLAQGKAIAGSTEAMARNPGAIGAIRGALILGLVFIESLALYTLVIVFLVK
ncbi:MAG TPA: ATP synthase F0 subunit C [Bryobacteraceae bacterium]|nr:ATP synthase F0 subunit C [Bryobacteraceae bacterium]